MSINEGIYLYLKRLNDKVNHYNILLREKKHVENQFEYVEKEMNTLEEELAVSLLFAFLSGFLLLLFLLSCLFYLLLQFLFF